jgi:hypothetical protein
VVTTVASLCVGEPPGVLWARVVNLPDALEINPAFYVNDVEELL